MKKTILKISIRLACFGILLSGALASAQASVWYSPIEHMESAGFDATKPNFVATADGAVYVTGHYKSGINVNQPISNFGGSDIYLIKYDSNKNVVWSKGFGGAADDTVKAITTDASGNVYLGGTFNSSTIAFGTTTLSATATSLFVVKIDSSGTVVWAKGSTHQTLNKDAIKALVVKGDEVYAGGDFRGGILSFGSTSFTNSNSTSDFFIEKLDASSGALQWVKSFGGNLEDNLNGLAVSNVNGNFNIIAVGSFDSSTVTLNNSKTLTNTTNSSTAPFSDLFVVAFDANGDAQWQKTVAGDKRDVAKAVATDATGAIYVVGNTNSPTLDIGTTVPVNNPSTYSMSYVLKLNGSGLASKLVIANRNTLDAVCVNSNSNTVYVCGRENKYPQTPPIVYNNIASAFDTNLVFKVDYSNAISELYSSSIAVDANDYLILGTYGKDKTSISKKIRNVPITTGTPTIADLPASATYFMEATGGNALAPTETVINFEYLFQKPDNSDIRNAILVVLPSSPPPVSYNYFLDSDGDGFGSTTSITSFLSTPPTGYTLNSSDCDDTDATKFKTYYKYQDADLDGHLKLISTICAGATAPTGYVSVAQTADDCDDTNATVHPGAVEITNEIMDFNGLDNDCNGYVDDTKVTTTYITALTNYIFCQKVRNAQLYKFYVTNSFSGLTWEIETTEPKIKVNELSGSRYVYDDHFYVAVALKRNNEWLPYGPTQNVYTQAAPTTSIKGNQCGATFLDTNKIIYVQPVNLADSYRIQLDTESEMVYYDVPNGETQFLLSNFPASSSNVYHISVTFLQGNKVFNYGQQCDINIKSSTSGGSSQSIITGANVTTKLTNCGATLVSMLQSIYADFISGATSYKFSVTGNGINGSEVIETPNRFFSLTSLSTTPMFGETYTVSVSCLLNGIWSTNGTACTVTTPALSGGVSQSSITTQMVLCGTTLVALRQSIYCVGVDGATKYRFRVGGANGSVIETPNRFFNLTQVGGQLGTTYGIEVAALLNGLSWTSYGTSCNVTTPSPARLKAKTFEVSAYPNPFETAFNLNLETPSKEDVTIAVYDMMGKLVESHQLNPTEVANLQIGNNFAAGIYNVMVSQANEMQAIRLIRK
jgi:hypothetical protein